RLRARRQTPRFHPPGGGRIKTVVGCQWPVASGSCIILTTGHRPLTTMKLSDLTNRAGEWLRGSGPMSEIVISSRIRLARNVSGIPFLGKCSRHQRQSLEAKARDTILSANLSPQMLYVDLEGAPDVDRQLLVDRHLISKH